jgi:hypothetical protein
MIEGKRARRRGDDLRMKTKARRVYWPSWGVPSIRVTPGRAGKAASVHGVPCSCWLHEEPRRPEPDWRDDML